jgi:heme exporter protein D
MLYYNNNYVITLHKIVIIYLIVNCLFHAKEYLQGVELSRRRK